MSFISKIFGSEKPTTVVAGKALAELEAELRDAPARIATAQKALTRLADMSDEEHALAEAELASARRSETRLTAQIEQLRAVQEQAAKAEAAEALRARAKDVQQRIDREAPKLLARYETLASQMASLAASIDDIETESAAVNRAIHAARRADPSGGFPEPVITTTERFRTVPESVDPDRSFEEEQWGSYDVRGEWVPTMTFVERDGKMVPTHAGQVKRTVTRVIRGRTHKGRCLPSPTHNLVLPAARLDAPAFWPRGS